MFFVEYWLVSTLNDTDKVPLSLGKWLDLPARQRIQPTSPSLQEIELASTELRFVEKQWLSTKEKFPMTFGHYCTLVAELSDCTFLAFTNTCLVRLKNSRSSLTCQRSFSS